ncbi:MAG: pyruvate kinase [Candidatus Paceibacterota bacterium]|jgi:pyruvate kinase
MNIAKKTKIVCTIGPATESADKIEKLIQAGMDIARFNFSHDKFEVHERRFDTVKEVEKKIGKSIKIMQDLCGPKIRVGTFKGGMVELKQDQTFTLTTDDIEGGNEVVSINHSGLPKEIKVGNIVLLQDGTRKLEVMEINGNEIITKVIIGGKVQNNVGMNIPGAGLSLDSITEKDMRDIEFGVKNKVDLVALSFVRNAGDIIHLKQILKDKGLTSRIIAKIETPEALKDIDEIIKEADGIMVARGDLSIEVPAEEVPLIQKTIIYKCNVSNKPVIVATQMMESMVKNPIPTRAEVSDVANAIIDGADAVMLSEETAIGEYPIETVKEMAEIAMRIESEVHIRDKVTEF